MRACAKIAPRVTVKEFRASERAAKSLIPNGREIVTEGVRDLSRALRISAGGSEVRASTRGVGARLKLQQETERKGLRLSLTLGSRQGY